MAPQGCESVMALVPVPNEEILWDSQRLMPELRNRILRFLEAHLLPRVQDHIVFEKQLPPCWYGERYALAGSSAFGLLPSFFQSAMFRPQRRCPEIRGLYFTGASTHPGNGVPIVLLAGRFAAEAVVEDYGIPQGVPLSYSDVAPIA